MLYDLVVTTWTVSDARGALPEILDRVTAGEEVVLTRHGRAIAVIVRPDALRSRRAERALRSAEDLHDRLIAARLRSEPGASLGRRRAEKLVADVRSARDAR